jgi:deoxyribodipyrimidine photo-lyase
VAWFRRDLHSFENAALLHALKQGNHVYCVFIFDKEILEILPRQDRRVEFIFHDSALPSASGAERIQAGIRCDPPGVGL